MAKSPPSFDLFPHDLIASTSHLTPEAFGAYMRLLCHQWMHGSVPRDARKIARIIGAFGERELGEIMAEVLPFFDESECGGLVQSRMEKDRHGAIKRWEDRKHAADVHRECGRLGGRPKRASLESINQIETILVSECKPNQNQFGFENNQIGSVLGNQTETKTKPNAGRGKREGVLEDLDLLEIENQSRNTKPPYPPSPDGKGEDVDRSGESASPAKTKTKTRARAASFDPVAAVAGEPWSDELRDAWADWVSHRREKRAPLTATTCKGLAAKFRDWGDARAIAAIRHSIEHGWQGLFEPETPTLANGKPRKDPVLAELEARVAAFQEQL